jgi:hypothetical protein
MKTCQMRYPEYPAKNPKTVKRAMPGPQPKAPIENGVANGPRMSVVI